MEAKQTHLIDLLERVPHNARCRVDEPDGMGSVFIPVGKLCHEAAVALRAALAEPVSHGCHVDLEEGMEPDGCVLDANLPHECIYAGRLLREGKDKTACEYWQPIEVKR